VHLLLCEDHQIGAVTHHSGSAAPRGIRALSRGQAVACLVSRSAVYAVCVVPNKQPLARLTKHSIHLEAAVPPP